jgi:hypothetical protein
MRKCIFALLLLALTLFIAAALAWSNKKAILTHLLSKQLHTAVSIESFDLNRTGMNLSNLWIGNPSPSKTQTAFTAQNFAIETTVDQVLATPLIIDEIAIRNIFVGIEFYNQKGDDNNWARMMGTQHKKVEKPRPYLIRHLVLTNLTVEVTKKDGSTKRYPTIAKMEFYNISDETGFPIEEIQKAIFKLMLQDLFKQLNLDQLFQGLFPNAPANSPIRIIPKLFQ